PLLLHGPGIQESPWIDNRRLAASPGCSPCKDARVGPQGPGTDDAIDHWYHLAQDGGRRTRKKKGSGRGLRVPHRHPFVADPAVGCHVETVGTVAIRRHDPDVGARLCQGFAETERAVRDATVRVCRHESSRTQQQLHCSTPLWQDTSCASTAPGPSND